jgi:hypothetical protein
VTDNRWAICITVHPAKMTSIEPVTSLHNYRVPVRLASWIRTNLQFRRGQSRLCRIANQNRYKNAVSATTITGGTAAFRGGTTTDRSNIVARYDLPGKSPQTGQGTSAPKERVRWESCPGFAFVIPNEWYRIRSTRRFFLGTGTIHKHKIALSLHRTTYVVHISR